MKRKKTTTTPPAKEETPAKEENSVSENLGTHQLSEGEDSYPQEVEEKILEQKNKEMTVSEIVNDLPNIQTLLERIDSDKFISGLEDYAKNFDDPRVKQLEKELLKEKSEKQTYKDILAEKEYQAFQKDRLKAENGSGSSTHQILWLMVDEYKRAVMDSVDKKRIYKEVFFGLKRFKKFRLEMYKEFDKSMFPKERSLVDYIRIAETQLYHETKNEEFKLTDGRPTNKFKNYIPKYLEDTKPEPPDMVSLNEEEWSNKSAPNLIKPPKGEL